MSHTAPPPILLITTDQLRHDLFGSNPAWGVSVPNLDRLRREGTTLAQATSVCPVCMPQRFAWMSGLYPSQGAARLMDNCHDWPTDVTMYPQALQEAGYHTSLVGKLHCLAGLYRRDIVDYEDRVHAMGFDAAWEVSGKSLAQWFDCRFTRHLESVGMLERYRDSEGSAGNGASWLELEHTIDALIADEATARLADMPRDRPWFMHVSFCNPHPPYDPPAGYAERHTPDEMPPPSGIDDADEIQRWRRQRAAYAGLVELVDDQVGRVLSCLEARGDLDRTVVVFTTDHGDMLGDRGEKGKMLPYEASVRTPVIVRYPPRVTADQTLDDCVESVDLPVTLCDIAGHDVPQRCLPQTPGRSLWPRLCSEDAPTRAFGYAEYGNGDTSWRMVRDRRWKYVYRDTGEELYHLEADPDERVNRCNDAECGSRLGELRAMLIGAMSRCVRPNQDGGEAVIESAREMERRGFSRQAIEALPDA